jgi:hypothetical protein
MHGPKNKEEEEEEEEGYIFRLYGHMFDPH